VAVLKDAMAHVADAMATATVDAAHAAKAVVKRAQMYAQRGVPKDVTKTAMKAVKAIVVVAAAAVDVVKAVTARAPSARVEPSASVLIPKASHIVWWKARSRFRSMPATSNAPSARRVVTALPVRTVHPVPSALKTANVSTRLAQKPMAKPNPRMALPSPVKAVKAVEDAVAVVAVMSAGPVRTRAMARQPRTSKPNWALPTPRAGQQQLKNSLQRPVMTMESPVKSGHVTATDASVVHARTVASAQMHPQSNTQSTQ
jgi:hypothetical protein